MTLKHYRDIYNDLIKDKIHTEDCYCASCLYQFYKSLRAHKHSKKRKENFFFGWLLVMTGKEDKSGKKPFIYNMEEAEKLFREISGTVIINLGYPYKDERVRIAYRYVSVVLDAIRDKNRTNEILTRPETIENISTKVTYMAIKKCLEFDKKFEERLLNFIKEKETVSQRELLRHFSDKRLDELSFFLRTLDAQFEIFWDIKRKKIHYLGRDSKKISSFLKTGKSVS